MHQEPLEDYPLEGERTIGWLYTFVREHGGTFDSRHTRWMLGQKIEKESMAANIHDLVGLALELGLCYDQLDGNNLASFEVMGCPYQLSALADLHNSLADCFTAFLSIIVFSNICIPLMQNLPSNSNPNNLFDI